MNNIVRCFDWAARLCVAFAGLVYLLVPTSYFQTLISMPEAGVSRVYRAALFLGILGAALSYAFSRALSAKAGTARYSTSSKPRITSKTLSLIAFGSALVLVETFRALIGNPLTWDENAMGTVLATHSFRGVLHWVLEGSFMTTSMLHPIAMLFSWVSMQILGAHELHLRLPSVIFAAGFLGILGWFAYQHLTRFAAFCLYAHLCANTIAIWYLGSARGYVSMMMFAMVPTAIAYAATNDPHLKIRKLYIPFALGLFATAFSNANGGMFSFLLTVGLALWLVVNHERISKTQAAHVRMLLLIGLCLVPLSVLGNAAEVLVQNKYGHFSQLAADPSLVLGYLLGHSRAITGKVTALFCLGLLVHRWRTGNARDLLTLWLGFSGLFYAMLVTVLDVDYFPPRYVLGLLVPYVLWIAQSSENVRSTWMRRATQAGVLALLVIVPIVGHQEVWKAEASGKESFQALILKARQNIPPGEYSCIRADGEGPEAVWTRSLYLVGSGNKDRAACQKRYSMSFAYEKRTPANESGSALYSDDEGRALYLERE